MAAELDFSNIQGDILVGLAKNTQLFFFFEITDVDAFRSQLTSLVPLITTAENAEEDRAKIREAKIAFQIQRGGGNSIVPHPRTVSVAGVNLALSAKGINKLGITENIQDDSFTSGMLNEAQALGDNGTAGPDPSSFKPDWDDAFLEEIHGVILITGDNAETVNSKLAEVKAILTRDGKSVVREIKTLVGDVRPGENRGHEHFGYKDGVSQPFIEGGVEKAPLPGQTSVPPGVALVRSGDKPGRPEWAVDGSFLAFRKLPQLVPEFDRFLEMKTSPILGPGTQQVEPKEFLGARLVGRWKSGAPIRLAEIEDNPEMGNDPLQNNNFHDFPAQSQNFCPFAAHIRKMNPRGDTRDSPRDLNPHMILRRGIAFGVEVTDEEKSSHETKHERGLYFVCYQSDLSKGFSFLMQAWANNPGFPVNEPEEPGLDAIIGQTNGGGPRTISGAVKGDPKQSLTLDKQWVNSKGGEYFFSPSILALRNTFAKTD